MRIRLNVCVIFNSYPACYDGGIPGRERGRVGEVQKRMVMEMCEQNTSKVLKDNLIILRRRGRMTQEQLAGKLGLTFQAVSKWENGLSCPDITLLPQIAEIFGVTVDDLFRPISPDEPAAEADPEPEPAEEPETVGEEPPEDFGASLGEAISRRVCKALKGLTKLGEAGFEGRISRQVEDAISAAADAGGKGAWAFEKDCCLGSCREPGQGAAVDGLPWEDDGVYRAVLFRGKTLVTVPVEGKGSICWQKDLDHGLLSAFRVECGDISGPVFVQCGDVAGPVSAGGKVECGDVGGSVSAGGRVNCGDVGESASVCGDVACGDVKGDVKAGANVTADTIEGDARAEIVTCGEIGGNVICQELRR